MMASERNNNRRSISMLGLFLCFATILAASAPAQSATTINITAPPYNAVGDGKTDNQNAIELALHTAATAKPQESVYVPSGVFAHSGLIDVDGITVYGATVPSGNQPTSVLLALSPSLGAVRLFGTDAVFENIMVTSPNTTVRLGASWEAGVWVDCAGGSEPYLWMYANNTYSPWSTPILPSQAATSFTVSGAWVGNPNTYGAGCAGIHVGGSNGTVTGCSVYNTGADGITMMDGASSDTIEWNTIVNSGDDMISVVSNAPPSPLCNNITIANNTCVSQNWGRGITVVGGAYCGMYNNSILSSCFAGLYFASEASNNTAATTNCGAYGNSLNNINENTSEVMGAVMVFGRSGYVTSGITVQNNTIGSVEIGGSVSMPYGYVSGIIDTPNTIMTTAPASPLYNANYTLTPQNGTGYCLDASGGGSASGTSADIWSSRSTANQVWTLTNLGGVIYKVQPSYDLSLCLDANSATNNTLIDLNTYSGAASQQWIATSISGGDGHLYKFSPVSAPGYCLTGPSPNVNGYPDFVYAWNSGAPQIWDVETPSEF